MKFKNKETQEIIEVKGYTLEYAYGHNSNWIKVEEKSTNKKKTE